MGCGDGSGSKSLPHKHEDLGLILQKHIEKVDEVHMLVILALGMQRKEDPDVFLIFKFQDNESPCHKHKEGQMRWLSG